MSRSRANVTLANALRSAPGIELRPLYDLYPDFDIDVAAEQRALHVADLIVWMHPIYWYSAPGLLKHWFEKVLTLGWAYGEGGDALHGKHCLWVPTTGGDASDYSTTGMHGHPFADFAPPIEQTARFCGMLWETPHVVHGAITVDDAELARHAAQLLQRLAPWQSEVRSDVTAAAAS